MTPTDKLEMQEAADGSATVTLPDEDKQEQQVEVIEVSADEANSQNDASETPSRSMSDSEREKLRESRRLERQNKKHVQRKKFEENAHIISALKRQNDDLATRLANVENRTSGAELARVDKSIDDSQLRVQYAQQKISEALTAQDGDAMVKAQEMLYESKRALEQLSSIKQNMLNAAREPQHTNLQVPDARVQKNAVTWMQKHTWYKPDLSNTDSKIAHAVDVEMHNEGWDPSTEEYWEELDDRLSDRMPYRFNDEPTQPQKRRSPVTGSGRESVSTEKAGVFKLTPDRVNAMKETGSWFDPKRKAKMVQYYMDYDKQNKVRN